MLVPPVNHQGEQHNIKKKMNQQNHDFSSESLSEKIAYYFFLFLENESNFILDLFVLSFQV